MDKEDITDIETINDMVNDGYISHSIINTDFEKIKKIKNNVLKNMLYIEDNDYIEYLEEKLDRYRFIDGMDELTYGSYIRWINFDDPYHKLKIGGFICDISITYKGVIIKCRNRTRNMFQINLSKCVIFQMISEQEHIVLSTLQHIINKR
uniref:Uncharacterized protein n=1 Tax=viral metagenome TaxID=1070528 RepID=A0A6C0BT40_9ZZZZ